MKIKALRVLAAAAVALPTTPVYAAPVDNPGFFFWDTGSGDLAFNQSTPISQTLGISSGIWDTDIDGNGDITINAMSIAPVTISTYTVQLLVTAGSSTGNLNASFVGNNTSVALRLRVRITGNNAGNNCITPAFTVPLSGDYSFLPIPQLGELYLYTNGFVTVPALPPGSCMGQENTINSLLGFGPSQQGLEIERLRASVTLGPQGS